VEHSPAHTIDSLHAVRERICKASLNPGFSLCLAYTGTHSLAAAAAQSLPPNQLGRDAGTRIMWAPTMWGKPKQKGSCSSLPPPAASVPSHTLQLKQLASSARHSDQKNIK